MYVPPGTARPAVRLSVVPVRAVSSSSATTTGRAGSSSVRRSGQTARAVSPAATTSSRAQPRPPALSAHNHWAGSQPTYRSGEAGTRSPAGTVPNARSPHAGSPGRGSRTSGTTVPDGVRSRTVEPGAARTASRTPSPGGSASTPRGAKLVVSIHAARPGAGWKRGAIRAVKVTTCESPATVATSRTGAIVSSGSATHAIQAPLGCTTTGAPLTVRPASPRPTLPNRNAESRDCTTSVTLG